jgi:hypothetical protein
MNIDIAITLSEIDIANAIMMGASLACAVTSVFSLYLQKK